MKYRILIVDDLPDGLYMLRSLLEGHGHFVSEAADGREALATARAEPPDVVVTDLMMPGMDGFDLCRAWMRDEELWRIPFVVYTATYTDAKDRQLVLDLGADRFLIKPTDPDVLLQAIEEVVGQAKTTKAGRDLPDADFFERHAERLQEKLDRKLGQVNETRQTLASYVSRSETILDVAPFAIVGIDGHGAIQTWNYAAERLFGFSEAEIQGRSIASLMVAGDGGVESVTVDEIFAVRSTLEREVQLVHRDGHLLDVAISVAFLGPGTGFVLVASDVSERREQAQERQRLEEQLVFSQRMESIGRFAGGVAHDFNNMLAVVMGCANMILVDQSSANQRCIENAHMILDAATRAAALTQQLLAVSRRQNLAVEVLDVNAVVGDMVEMLRRLIGERVELVVDFAEQLGRVEMDASRLEQVIMNLVINGKDAMNDGGRLIVATRGVRVTRSEAERRPSLRPGRFVVLSVSDDGCGMDEPTKSRVFDPFFTTKEQGTGLGLSTVYGIVKQSGGYISANSEVGKGSTFEVYLPWVTKDLTTRGTVASPTATDGRGETILVVEDNELVRRMTALMLENAGYRVLEVADADGALRLLEESATWIDLLVTDVILPGTGGRELARRVQERQPECRVVYVSGNADTTTQPGIPDGPLVEKPFTVEALMSAVRAALDREASGE